jgi:hypothetical protein
MNGTASQADFFNLVRVRVDGKCKVIDMHSAPRPAPFPEMSICEWTGQPYTAWCETHRRYHQDHGEPWTEICQLG